jgi:SAM-dependent methyltransferase
MMDIPGEVIALFTENGTAILYNVFSRTCLALSPEALAEFQRLAAGRAPGEGPFTVWETGRFSNEDGLLADPTRILRDARDWPPPLSLSGKELAALLRERHLLVEDREEYLARFKPKSGLLDFVHFGNFHQQLGQHLMAVKRINPEKWWYDQKFLPDFSGMQDNLYKSVQEAFLEQFFARAITPGMRVVDVGAGVGYISRMMARAGAEVIALDPNPRYVELAEGSSPGNARFHRANIGLEPMSVVDDGWADAVFMSDALLFYFIPERPAQKADIGLLLRDIRRMLKPGGQFWSLEPHAAFFLAPRMGEPDRPFTLLTEYRHRNFGIVPSLSDTLGVVLGNGFVLSGMRELSPSPTGEAYDARAHHFAEEFPQWQFLEFTKTA